MFAVGATIPNSFNTVLVAQGPTTSGVPVTLGNVGVRRYYVSVWGAGGGGGTTNGSAGATGGTGGFIEGEININSSTAFTAYVGSGGGSGGNAGGGGGGGSWSGLFSGTTAQFLAAGGGGGGGGRNTIGGRGGGAGGLNGSRGWSNPNDGGELGTQGGGGGTQSAGGVRGESGDVDGFAGSAWTGADPGRAYTSGRGVNGADGFISATAGFGGQPSSDSGRGYGGGGGAGYYGGGSGGSGGDGNDRGGGGGGGGSSYINPVYTGLSMTAGSTGSTTAPGNASQWYTSGVAIGGITGGFLSNSPPYQGGPGRLVIVY